MKKAIVLPIFLMYLTGCSTIENRSEKKITESKVEKQEVKKIDYQVLEVYTHNVPDNVKFTSKYERHPKSLNYVLVKTETANVREMPGISSPIIEKRKFTERFRALEKVTYQGTEWYKVELENGREGFISKQLVEYRTFRFDFALENLNKALNFTERANSSGKKLAIVDTYRPDPSNQSQKRDKDKYGTTEDQSLIGINSNGEEVFIPDRSIVEVLDRLNGKARVKVSSIPAEESLTVSDNGLSFKRDLENGSIKKAIVVDIANQNKMIFEKFDGDWHLISYVYTKTGYVSELGYETPKGHFIAATTKSKMYYNDGLGKEQGYAKDATRFSGGGYLHSTPLDNSERGKWEYNLAVKEAGLGTYPGTRKCIRTTEKHAKFMREWIMGDSFNPNVYEQSIKDDVLFVIF
ncbi:MAG: L,D-transpeptidase family protein [Fusobacteriaceae bacterium]